MEPGVLLDLRNGAPLRPGRVREGKSGACTPFEAAKCHQKAAQLLATQTALKPASFRACTAAELPPPRYACCARSPRRGRASACGRSSPRTQGSLASCVSHTIAVHCKQAWTSGQESSRACAVCGPPHATCRLPCTADSFVPAHWIAQPYSLHCRNKVVVATAELSPGGESEVACHHAAQHLRRFRQGAACR